MRTLGVLVASALLVGCDGGSIDPAPDAESGGDAGVLAQDGGPPPDCQSDPQCADAELCTIDRCEAGACTHVRNETCGAPCTTDADCEDGDPSTHAYCDLLFHACVSTPCLVDLDCDDADPCTLDYCLPMDRCGHSDNHLCCSRSSDCADPYICTVDTCEAGMCVFTPMPSCGGCPDFDGDGSGAISCGGTDCDDSDPAVGAGASESCNNSRDDDCDGLVDLADDSCAPPYFACGGGSALTSGSPTSAVTLTRPGGTGCGGSAFFTLDLAQTSDVDITVEIAPRCTDCPSPTGSTETTYRAYLETTCGDVATDLFGSVDGVACNYWDPAGGSFTGQQSSTYSRRRVPAGHYTLEVRAGQIFAWMTGTTSFTVTARALPSASAVCDGPSLEPGVPAHGDTSGGPDAFGLACDGTVSRSPERAHPFTLASRSRVRLTATPDPIGGSSPSVRLEILDRCDASSATRLACQQSRGFGCQLASTIEQVLEAGDYFALVESSSGVSIGYSLDLHTEAPGASCLGVPVIAASGMYSGTTAGAADLFRDPIVCGGGTGPDVVYRLELAAPARVVLDLIPSYTNPTLRLGSDCGETWIARPDTPHVDVVLEAGSYDVIVGGAQATDAGSFVLSATLL